MWGSRRLAPTIIVRVTVDHCLHYRPRESWYNTTLQRHRSWVFFVAFFFQDEYQYSPAFLLSAKLGSVGIREVGIREVGISLLHLSAMLAGLLLQHTLHTSVWFMRCNRYDPRVLVAWKLCGQLSMGMLLLSGI